MSSVIPLPDYVKLAPEDVTSYTASVSALPIMLSVAPERRTLLLADEDRPSVEMEPYRTNESGLALHTPVLLGECLAALDVKQGESYIDATIGLGGHAERILEAIQPQGRLLGIDADPEAIRIASSRLARYRDRAVLVSGNFRDLGDIAFDHGFSNVAGIIFDLGISSLQLAAAERGFSFQAAGPLDMRMNPEQDRTAADLVNSLGESDLVTLLQHYGEEPAARHIARTLVRQRPFQTTTELASAIAAAAPRRGARTHPATRTFQALRIAVNDELEGLRQGLKLSIGLLGPGGRLAVVSFHSLEDRIVKDFIRSESRDCICPPAVPICVCSHQATLRSLHKSVIRPSGAEIMANPRSRSARLRVAERV